LVFDRGDDAEKGCPDSPTTPPEWIFDTRVDQEFIEVDGVKYQRDEDTFDTWFSSGQWPYIVTRGDLTRFYPTSVMETGTDILRPWVARMIMLGLYIADEVPFREVYLHGLVNDEKNQKMSKSKGNVINPMDIVEKYGSDAMRMGIIANRSAALGQAFSTATVLAARNFCNKLWNIARFVQESSSAEKSPTNDLFIADHWILRQLDNAREQVEKQLREYRFAEAFETIYHVVWDDVADWYVEASKLNTSSKMLRFVLEYCLKLAHPFAPFVTEAIWQSLYNDDKSTILLISQQWVEKLEYNELAAAEFDAVRDLVTEVRYLTHELGGKKRALQYQNDRLVAENADLIRFLARLSGVEQSDAAAGLRLATLGREAWLEASQTELDKHYETLENRLATTRAEILKLENRLANKGYTQRAPAELVRESRIELAAKQALAERLEAELKSDDLSVEKKLYK
jgi:valyl-tRNA synthetase